LFEPVHRHFLDVHFTAMIDVRKYKKRLLEIEKNLELRSKRDLEDARGEMLDTAHDTGDASVSDVAVGDEFTEAELNSTILQQVRDALRRIDDGTFGTCEICGGPIGSDRLRALPWARLCIDDQRRAG